MEYLNKKLAIALNIILALSILLIPMSPLHGSVLVLMFMGIIGSIMVLY